MDFLLDALDEVASEIFWSVAHLPDLDAGIVLVGRAPACWELERPPGWARQRPATAAGTSRRRKTGTGSWGVPRITVTTCPRW